MKAVFICRGNVFRSRMAALLFDRMTGGTHEVISAGTMVRDGEGKDLDGQLMRDCADGGDALAVFQEYGFDVSNDPRRRVLPDMMTGADIVVVMADEETVPEFVRANPMTVYWDVADPKGTDVETHQRVTKEIEKLIAILIKDVAR
jgi:protein-tyrosine-phosphatase